MPSFYSFLKVFFRLALKCYFKKIEIVGIEKVPTDSPLLITPNHQNAFLDAFLVGAFSPVPLHFLTRSDVFTWWSKPIMKLLNMMPVYRIRDGYSRLSENEVIFETCKELFSKNKSILMFAEGNHGEHHYLRPLTKGAARLAIQSQQVIESELKVVPIGLNYFDHQASNSKVIVVFGTPIPISEFVDIYQQSSGLGLNALRDEITSGMKSTLIIPEQTDNYEALRKTILQKENEDLTFEELRNIKASDSVVAEARSGNWMAKILNPLPFLVIWKVISSVKDVVFHSSLKFAIGLILFPLWWLLCFFILLWFFGIIPATIVVLLMIFSLPFSYRWLK